MVTEEGSQREDGEYTHCSNRGGEPERGRRVGEYARTHAALTEEPLSVPSTQVRISELTGTPAPGDPLSSSRLLRLLYSICTHPQRYVRKYIIKEKIFFFKRVALPSVVVHTLITALGRQKQADLCEVSLVYKEFQDRQSFVT